MPQYVIYYEEGETNGPFSIFLSGSSGLTLYSSSVSLAQLQAGFIITFDDGIPSSSVLIDTQAYGCDVAQQLTFPSPTPTRTPSITITPSITRTPSLTPTITPSYTPSITVPPSLTPSITLSISTSPPLSPGASLSPTPTISVTRTPSATPTAGGVSITVTNSGSNPYPIQAGNGSASGTISNTTSNSIYVYLVFNSAGYNSGTFNNDTGIVGATNLSVSGTITSYGQKFYSVAIATINNNTTGVAWNLLKQDGLSFAVLQLGYSTSPGGFVYLL
jgi:hypothetical protein